MERRYGDLLHPAQRDFLDAFSQLDKNDRALLVRLLSRKGQMFRVERLSYAEIGDLSGPLAALKQAQLITELTPESIPQATLPALLSLYTKPELLSWIAASKISLSSSAYKSPKQLSPKQLSRPELDATLLACMIKGEIERSELNPLLHPDPSSNFGVIALADWLDDALDRFRLLYFGNLHQGMTDFVLRDLGLQQYADYSLTADSRLFQTPEQIEQHLTLSRITPDEDQLKQLDAEALFALHMSLPFHSQDRVLKRRTLRLRARIGRQLERLKQEQLAYRVYRHCPVPPARERRIRLLSKFKTGGPAKTLQRSLVACRRRIQNPGNDAELTFARQNAARLATQFQNKRSPDSNWIAPAWLAEIQPPDIRQQFISVTPQQLTNASSVESLALECLQEQQPGMGFYVENALFTALFGLLYWPVIFADVPGAFFHPFQRRPDDLYEPDFAEPRRALIQQVEQQLASGTWQASILDHAQRYAGIQNPFVNWAFVQHAQENGCFEQALERISSEQMLAISRNLLGDLKYRRAGLPDLILFPDQGGFELVEVKGPTDSLQPHQIGWLEYFQRAGIPASVLYLTLTQS